MRNGWSSLALTIAELLQDRKQVMIRNPRRFQIKMKPVSEKILVVLAVSLLAASASAAGTRMPAIVLLPQKPELHPGVFQLGPGAKIFADYGSLQTARQ